MAGEDISSSFCAVSFKPDQKNKTGNYHSVIPYGDSFAPASVTHLDQRGEKIRVIRASLFQVFFAHAMLL